jgi:hypothetical protein
LGYGTAQNFKSKVFKVLLILERFPEIGTLEVPEKQIRSFAVTSKTQGFYRIRKENVVVLTFFDVRQNPKKKFK